MPLDVVAFHSKSELVERLCYYGQIKSNGEGGHRSSKIVHPPRFNKDKLKDEENEQNEVPFDFHYVHFYVWHSAGKPAVTRMADILPDTSISWN